jgi:hypothetical protein
MNAKFLKVNEDQIADVNEYTDEMYFNDNGLAADGNALLVDVDDLTEEQISALVQAGAEKLEGEIVAYGAEDETGAVIPVDAQYWTGWSGLEYAYAVMTKVVDKNTNELTATIEEIMARYEELGWPMPADCGFDNEEVTWTFEWSEGEEGEWLWTSS